MNRTETTYKTPAERLDAARAAEKKFDTEECLVIYEPCNCGSQIRHNNGGNYHQIVSLKKENEQYFAKFDTTSDVGAPAEWEEIPKCEAYQIISELADWL